MTKLFKISRSLIKIDGGDMFNTNLPENIQHLYDAGYKLKERIVNFLNKWPVNEKNEVIYWENIDQIHKNAVFDLTNATQIWFNSLNINVLPYVLYNREFLYYVMRQVVAAIKKHYYKRPYPESGPRTVSMVDTRPFLFGVGNRRADIDYETTLDEAKKDAEGGMDTALSIIKSMPPLETTGLSARQNSYSGYTPNTAFILMWMDKSNPGLDDVCNTIKDICTKFGIRAFRADDVEHQDKITDVILQHITNSEYLIADLTGERPNVYYEVGYAHAIGKRPILYRKQGTKLHFDLSVHNIPEYKNMTELKELLIKRFEAITGRKVEN